MHFLMFLKVNNVNNYNHITYGIFDECAPVVKLVELYASGEHPLLCLCCPARLVGPGCTLPLCEASYVTDVFISHQLY